MSRHCVRLRKGLEHLLVRAAGLTALLWSAFLMAGVCEIPAQENLVQNPDLEAGTYRFENLWDGVDSQGRLKLLEGSSPAVVDLNGDGNKDLLVGEGRGLIFYYLNTGTNKEPKFTSGVYIRARFDDQVRLAAADWNADGRVDLLIGGRNGWVYFLKNRGSKTEFNFVTREPRGGRGCEGTDYLMGQEVGTPDTPRGIWIPQRVVGEHIKVGGKMLDIGQYSAPAVADWDGDGRIDLILGEGTYGADSVYVYLNSGSNTNPQFAAGAQSYIAYGEGRVMLCPAVADWDGDGLLDLLVGDETGRINVYSRERGEKAGIAAFRGALSTRGGEIRIPGARPAVADWDEDGDLDIICGGQDGLVYLIRNDGSASNPSLVESVPLTGEDAKKDTDVPNSWGFGSVHSRIGAYQPSISTEDPKSGKCSLIIQCLDKYPGRSYVTVGLTKPLQKDADYILTFYTRGQGAGDCDWSLIYGVKGISPEGKRYANAASQAGNFVVGGTWKRIMERVHMPKDYDERGAATLAFGTYSEITFCLDNISLVRR